MPLPPVVPTEHPASLGLVTHLHLDHADACTAALQPGAPVFLPRSIGGDDVENAAISQAHFERRDAGLAVREVDAWRPSEVDGWQVGALPAADGTRGPRTTT